MCALGYLCEEEGGALLSDRPDAISLLLLGEERHGVQGMDRLIESTAEPANQDDLELLPPCRYCSRGRFGIVRRWDRTGFDCGQAGDVLAQVGRVLVRILLDGDALRFKDARWVRKQRR